MSWNAPRHDGGSKIKGYIVQKKHVNDKDWESVNTTPVNALVYTVSWTNRMGFRSVRARKIIIFFHTQVPKLKEGEEYLFRIIAVNEIGESDPSRPTNPIKIEEQPNKPCMDLGGVRDITIRAGEDFSIHVPFVAFPKPTATWQFNDSSVDEKDSRIHQQVS